jgi:two-component system, cell cycle response regulator
MTKKVLTIDDSKTLRTIVAKHLSAFSVKMLEAENGEEGLARAREGSPDLILLDYNMPVMDGYHTLVELKMDPALKSIPVVMVTTETARETVIKLLKLGLRDYISKPFTREVLLNKINPILELYTGDSAPEAAASATVKAAPAPEVAKRSVLVIDDKSSVLDLLSDYLKEKFQVTTADGGKAALELLDQRRFDYVFLDLSMPDISGFKVLEEYLKKRKEGASEKSIVAMSMHSAQSDIDMAFDQGVSIFLYKPFTRADAITAADNVIAQKEQMKKMRYLRPHGKVRILECPSRKSSRFQPFVKGLASDVAGEVEDMSKEGLDRLIVKIDEGFLSDQTVIQKFVSFIDQINQYNFSVRLVVDTKESHQTLMQYAETAGIPTDLSLEFAISSMS